MTTEEAKKAGFRPTRTALMNCWHLTKAGSIENVGVEFDNLSADDFPTRAKARDALRKRKLEAEHAKWLADMQAQTTPITPEQLELLHVGKDTVWAVHIAYGNSITREIYDGNKTFKCFHFSEASALATKQRLDDYEHEKWIKNHESQTTPITPEQAKMLSRDDVVFMYDIASLGISGIRGDTAIKDNSYVTSPLFFTEQAARDRLNEVIAAQAALDKAKCSTLPEGVAPVPEGYEFVDPNKIEIVMVDSKTYIFDVEEKRWHLLNGFNSGLMVSTKWNLEHGIYFARPKAEAEPLKKHGHKGMIHYNNNNTNKWEPDTSALDELAKQAQELHMGYETDKPCVESHETPVGETQGKEVVTDETQPTILEEAAKCVTGPRRRDYGTPDENFSLIASLWSVQLKHEVTPMQVAMCLILLKVARQSNSPKRDNLVDIAGYAQCASELKGAK